MSINDLRRKKKLICNLEKENLKNQIRHSIQAVLY